MAGTRLDSTGTARPKGHGSVFLHKGRYWTAVVELPTGSDGKRRRRWLRAATREDAERLVEQFRDVDLPPRAPKRLYFRRLPATDAVRLCLERGRSLGWDDSAVARAVVAATAPARLQYGVFGPCVYCGDEFANTVDHVDPHGGDGIENVVSACRKCNNAKGKRTPVEWRQAQGKGAA